MTSNQSTSWSTELSSNFTETYTPTTKDSSDSYDHEEKCLYCSRTHKNSENKIKCRNHYYNSTYISYHSQFPPYDPSYNYNTDRSSEKSSCYSSEDRTSYESSEDSRTSCEDRTSSESRLSCKSYDSYDSCTTEFSTSYYGHRRHSS